MARGRPWIAAVVAVLVLAVSGTAIYLVFFHGSPTAGAGNQAAALTVFTGSVQETRVGTTTGVPGHTGDELRQGDRVATGDASKAALTFPDHSITRLDSNSAFAITTLDRAADGSLSVVLNQTAGRTWSNVKSLVGGSHFGIAAPNASTAEVRGTDPPSGGQGPDLVRPAAHAHGIGPAHRLTRRRVAAIGSTPGRPRPPRP